MQQRSNISWKAIKYGLTSPDNLSLYGASLAIFAGAALAAWLGAAWVGGVIAAVGLALCGVLFWNAVQHYRLVEGHNMAGMLHNWARAGESPQESARRSALIEGMPLATAMAAAGLVYAGPRLTGTRTAGTPGDNFIVPGNAFGDAGIQAGSFNAASNVFADPATAYESPLDLTPATPAVNTDGTPMIEGTMFDVHGGTYGSPVDTTPNYSSMDTGSTDYSQNY